ncbi:MAG: hypothetical protein VB096_08635 [Pseudoflavonifractor sp.]|nr:hypothetical protein [Pseudoflavonifractor sp.]
MIKIQNLSVPLDGTAEGLLKKAARALGVSHDVLGPIRMLRRSVDARKKTDVHYICTVGVEVEDEKQLIAKIHNPNVTLWTPEQYQFPTVNRAFPLRPVVVGMGPAGLFAALMLARNGVPSIILERGRSVEERTTDVDRFWEGGTLDENSNVQFGEGGAGTFSDGKLNTGTHDPRISAVLEEFVRHGAPEDILWQQKPHVGTDLLCRVVKNIRQELLELDCDIRFGHRLAGLNPNPGGLKSVWVEAGEERYHLDCDALVLAPGHSARDTFRMLRDAGIPMESKPFAIGCRIEHRQAAVSEAQFGPAWEKLPPADYKLACHLPNGRSAFTFCVCPGGQVVAAASESEGVVTNGMSLRARDGININGGFLVGVSTTDFGSGVLDGVAFQEQWEHAAFMAGGGTFRAPAQSVGDFLSGQPSLRLAGLLPTYRPGVTSGSLELCLPPAVTDTLRAALPVFDRKLRGFADADAILTGVETRSSSPVRILRDLTFQSSVRGIFPCGEGAGYAGGITSAAVDGIRVAEALAAGLK